MCEKFCQSLMNIIFGVLLCLSATVHSQQLYSGQSPVEANDIFWSITPECDDVIMNQDWNFHDTNACEGQTCNYPTEACFEDSWAAAWGDPPVYECRAIPQACLDKANGAGGGAVTTAPASSGTCPAPSGNGWCTEWCTSDGDCFPGEKCCSDGCGGTECVVVDAGTNAPTTTTTRATTTTTRATTTTTRPTTTTTRIYTLLPTASTTRPTTTTTPSTTTTQPWTTAKPVPITTVPGSLAVDPVCLEPLSIGFGIDPSLFQPRFYFNGIVCYPFVYLGAFGNGNNFATIEECQRLCPVEHDCFAPMEEGAGVNLRLRYYYTGTACTSMWFKGTGGNTNNFATLSACQNECQGKVRPTPSTTTQSTTTIPTTTTPTTTVATQPPVNVDCTAPQDRGTGRNYQRRYWHSAGACTTFWYAGLGGNTNNFPSEAECLAACTGRPAATTTTTDSTTTPAPAASGSCTMASDQGTGSAWTRRYFYNGAACELFWYAGAGGNVNNYNSMDACRHACEGTGGGVVVTAAPTAAPTTTTTTTTTTQAPTTTTTTAASSTNVCSQPHGDQGSGSAWTRRYGYTGASCELFWYAGSGGNANNFNSLADCRATCETATIVTTTVKSTFDCTSPRDQGAGRAWGKRHFFNYSTKNCEDFWYAGTGGNANNYLTHTDCVVACM